MIQCAASILIILIIGKNPLLPSFARFYFDMKIHYNVSENRILEMLKDMEAFMPQSSLNKWIHEIMTGLRGKSPLARMAVPI